MVVYTASHEHGLEYSNTIPFIGHAICWWHEIEKLGEVLDQRG